LAENIFAGKIFEIFIEPRLTVEKIYKASNKKNIDLLPVKSTVT